MRFEMSIAKFELSFPELRKAVDIFQKDRIKAFDALVDGVKNAIAASLNQILNAEIEVFLGLPGQEDNKRNGYTERDYALKHIGVVRLRQPNDRKKRFSSVVIPKHERMDPRISEDLAALSSCRAIDANASAYISSYIRDRGFPWDRCKIASCYRGKCRTVASKTASRPVLVPNDRRHFLQRS